VPLSPVFRYGDRSLRTINVLISYYFFNIECKMMKVATVQLFF
jgi:hypothetical protein